MTDRNARIAQQIRDEIGDLLARPEVMLAEMNRLRAVAGLPAVALPQLRGVADAQIEREAARTTAAKARAVAALTAKRDALKAAWTAAKADEAQRLKPSLDEAERLLAATAAG